MRKWIQDLGGNVASLDGHRMGYFDPDQSGKPGCADAARGSRDLARTHAPERLLSHLSSRAHHNHGSASGGTGALGPLLTNTRPKSVVPAGPLIGTTIVSALTSSPHLVCTRPSYQPSS